MLKSAKSIYLIELLLLVLLLVSIPITDTAKREIFCIISIGLVLFVSLLIYGNKKDNNALKVPATRITVSVMMSIFIIVFLLGIPLGFNKTLFSLDPNNWFDGLIPALLFTIAMEWLRFIVVVSNPFNRKGMAILTILFILCGVLININYIILDDHYRLFVFLCATIFPLIAQESLSTYITYHFGFFPNLVFKLIINLNLYLLPIMTNLGNYLYGAFNVIMPFAIFITLNKSINFGNDATRNRNNIKKVFKGFVLFPLLVALIIMVILVSGVFDYQIVAIASNSMIPFFSRGDAIIYEKIVDEDDIIIGDILVFRRDNKIVSHRVTMISNTTFGKHFFTKGDANDEIDSSYVVFDDIMGITRSTVKYVGYPTVLLNEMIGGE